MIWGVGCYYYYLCFLLGAMCCCWGGVEIITVSEEWGGRGAFKGKNVITYGWVELISKGVARLLHESFREPLSDGWVRGSFWRQTKASIIYRKRLSPRRERVAGCKWHINKNEVGFLNGLLTSTEPHRSGGGGGGGGVVCTLEQTGRHTLREVLDFGRLGSKIWFPKTKNPTLHFEMWC